VPGGAATGEGQVRRDGNLDYGLVGNCTSAALVGGDGSIDWLCLPFFDSPSVFARILDRTRGGHFRIGAVDLVSCEQAYLFHTAIVRTVFTTRDGVFEVLDYMPRFADEHRDVYCPSEIHRSIRRLAGRPRFLVELDPRPNYGLGEAQFTSGPEYLKITSRRGEYNSFYLYTDLDHGDVILGHPLELSSSAYFLLSYHEKLDPVTAERILVEFERTKSYWMSWAYRTRVPERYKEMAIRSIITLKLLMYQRTGAVIAAPTTSLPEIIGRDRNWDYRYCWVRDASMIIDLFARMGHGRSCENFVTFILNRMLLKHDDIGVLYSIHGERKVEERILDHLDGYADSRPVRIGNDAYRQKQNDVYGQLMETIYTILVAHATDIHFLDEEIWTAVRSLVNHVLACWREPDCGIWEHRGPPRHFLHSKLMNWVALDRAAKIACLVGRPGHAPEYLGVAQQIREDILAHGWDEEQGSFVMCYGSTDLDASVLLMLHYGFLDAQDPRMASTVRQVHARLGRDGLVFRYTAPDDFGPPENAFIVCTFWMINALWLIGEADQAREMLDRMVACANPFGLFSEDLETATGRLTGNFPQGYSHLAFLQTIFLLETQYDWSDAAKPNRISSRMTF
jgi:alpha,alpha-trehalase